MNQRDQDKLEAMVDAHGVAEVIHSLMVICSEKADHIRSSYDDEDLADEWEGVADDLGDIHAEGL